MIVVKVGGRVLANIREVIADLASIVGNGSRAILVHGGGDVVTEVSRRMGIEPRFVVSPSGIRSRYTTREELEVYTMVMAGRINKEIVAAAYREGVQAIGVSGADCSLLRAARKKRIVVVNEKGRRQVIPGGYTGRIVGVNKDCLQRLLEATSLLVVAPLALGEGGELLNVDADQATQWIAGAIKPEAVVFLTDKEGVIVENQVAEKLTVREAEELLPRIGHGMNRKLLAAIEAVRRGAYRAIITSGLAPRPVTRALNNKGTIIEP